MWSDPQEEKRENTTQKTCYTKQLNRTENWHAKRQFRNNSQN